MKLKPKLNNHPQEGTQNFSYTIILKEYNILQKKKSKILHDLVKVVLSSEGDQRYLTGTATAAMRATLIYLNSGSSAVLYFSPSNWSTWQNVTAVAIDDDYYRGRSYNDRIISSTDTQDIYFTKISAAENYVTVNTEDDDSFGYILSVHGVGRALRRGHYDNYNHHSQRRLLFDVHTVNPIEGAAEKASCGCEIDGMALQQAAEEFPNRVHEAQGGLEADNFS